MEKQGPFAIDLQRRGNEYDKDEGQNQLVLGTYEKPFVTQQNHCYCVHQTLTTMGVSSQHDSIECLKVVNYNRFQYQWALYSIKYGMPLSSIFIDHLK